MLKRGNLYASLSINIYLIFYLSLRYYNNIITLIHYQLYISLLTHKIDDS
nr:MAG TPA: hypothetical protein [Caudoviricetes sp.]